MSNVAEGFDCESRMEFARFPGIARRSTVEVQSLLYVALDADYISQEKFRAYYEQAAKTKGLIGGLKRAVVRRASPTLKDNAFVSHTPRELLSVEIFKKRNRVLSG